VYGPAPLIVAPTGVPLDWDRDGISTGIGVNSNINSFDTCAGPGAIPPNPAGETQNGNDDWNGLKYIQTPIAGTGGIPVPETPGELDIKAETVKQSPFLLLEGIKNRISQLELRSFNGSAEAKAESMNATDNESGKIALSLKSDNLDV
jgi:hypothetical protein